MGKVKGTRRAGRTLRPQVGWEGTLTSVSYLQKGEQPINR